MIRRGQHTVQAPRIGEHKADVVYLGDNRILPTGSTWYRFVSSDTASVVIIDGESVTIGANEIKEGYCNSVDGITTNNFKEIYLDGDITVAPGIQRGGATNNTLEHLKLVSHNKATLDMYRMFENYTALLTCCISMYDITDYYQAFYYNSSIEHVIIDHSTLRSDTVANDMYMFRWADNLKSFDGKWCDTSQCTTFGFFFSQCNSLELIDLRGWDTSNAIYMEQMFAYLHSVTSISLDGFDTSKCTAMNGMFREAFVLETLDLSMFDTSNVTAFNAFIRESYALTNLYLGDKWDMGKATNTNNMFYDCTSLTNVTGTVSNLKLSLDLSYSPLTRESALVFINGLSADASGKTLSLSSTTKALLTDDDIKIATDKGWSIA